MRLKQSSIVAALGLATLLGSAVSASAGTYWERHHPRRDEVIDRLHHQSMRIREERREGELSFAQAHYLRGEDRAIFRQEQFDAHLNGGHITRAEQRALNQEENGVSGQIGR